MSLRSFGAVTVLATAMLCALVAGLMRVPMHAAGMR